MTPNAVGMTTTGSTASSASASSSPVASPETAPAAADFLALLLLTIGLGSGAPQSETETTDPRAGDDGEPPAPAATTDLTALAATAPIAVTAAMPMTPALPIAVTAPPDRSAPQSGPTVETSATATTPPPMTIPDTAATPRTGARGKATAGSDAPAAAPEAHHALAELGIEQIDGVADAKPAARPEIAADSAPAPASAPTPRPVMDARVRPTASEDDPRDHEHDAAVTAPTATKATPVAPPTRQESVTSSKLETAERRPAAEPRVPMPPHGPDVVALAAHAEAPPRAVTTDAALGAGAAHAPAAIVEPQIIADQVVRAARLVVDDGLAQMRVDLDPPVLGAVRVQADVRGEIVMLTITAERPETQALLTQALPDIQQALVRRDVGPTSVAIIGSTTTPLSSDGRRAPERRPETPRERPTPHPGERRRTLRASRGISAVDITV